MKDFEGWQGRNDYAAYIRNLYTHDVSTKFIQHFKVVRWVNSPLDATSVKDASVNNGNEQITLKDDHGNVVVLSRGSNDTNNGAYRNRTITLNGITVASGAVSPGNSNTVKGTESYLLPWLWDVNTGKLVKSSDEKLYHWNTQGGTTEWTLPKDWQNLASVKVYQLTDQGKTNEKTVAVSGGKISLTAEAETPYVVTKGSEKQISVKWSEGMHVVDAGFNGGQNTLKDNWAVSGTGKAEVEGTNNAMLRLTGDVKVSQKLTDLTAAGKISPDSRVLFVNDGSKDRTWEIICDLAARDPHYAGICQSRNRGHQNAVLAGLMEAKSRCDITISIDCDGQDDINAMDAMVDAYRDGCDVVYGVRSKRETDTFLNALPRRASIKSSTPWARRSSLTTRTTA